MLSPQISHLLMQAREQDMRRDRVGTSPRTRIGRRARKDYR